MRPRCGAPPQRRGARAHGVGHAALRQIGEKVFVAHAERAVEAFGHMERRDAHGRPLCPDGVVAPFLFAAGPHHAVGRVRAVGVEHAPAVGAFGRFVAESPDETAREVGRGEPPVPEVAQPGSAALVVHGVHELGGQEDLVAVREAAHACEVGRVVMGVDAVEIGPRVDDVPPLQAVVTGEQGVDSGVPAALVAVAPQHDAGVVGVAFDRLAHETPPRFGVVGVVPAR